MHNRREKSRCQLKKLGSGFSLIELMMVVAILGIAVGIAMPTVMELVATQRIKNVTDDLYLSLMQARAEAIKQAKVMTVTPETGGWANGWSVKDPSGNVVLSNNKKANVSVSGTSTAFAFSIFGRLDGATPPSVQIGADGTNFTRCVKVDLMGRPAVKRSAC